MKQLKREKKELTFRSDRLDVINESTRLETETLKKEIAELTLERNQLKLELSAARIELNYEKEVSKSPPLVAKDEADSKSANEKPADDRFTDELIENIERLTKEKADLAEALEKAVNEAAAVPEVVKEEKRPLEDRAQQTEAVEPVEAKPCESCISQTGQIASLEAQVEKLRADEVQGEQRLVEVREAAQARQEADLAVLRSETAQLKERLEQEVEQSRVELDQLGEQMRARQNDLEAVQLKLAEAEAATKAAEAERELLSQKLSESQEQQIELKVDMGQNAEKLCAVEEKCKGIEKERDDFKRKCKEFEARIDVLNRSEKAAEKDACERLQQLEKALEEALVEREEILEAAEKEIQAQKTIAIETEQKMMDDFEWKLREIESEYRGKIKTLEDGLESQVKTAVDDMVRQKDEDFNRQSIAMRREMDEKMRLERNALKTALDTQNTAQREKAIDLYRIEKDREIRILQKSWEDEQDRLNREIIRLQRQIDNLPREIEAATREVRLECDAKLQEEKRKLQKADQKAMEEADKVRLEMSGQLRKVQAQNDEKIAEYEAKLEAAHGNRMSSMFQMKDEMESDFTERMEQLRDLFKKDLINQSEKLEQEEAKSRMLEERLRASVKAKQDEIDDLNSYYTNRETELEAKINELLTRLQEQTALSVKLQSEIDEYEWYEEEEEPQRPPSSRSQHNKPHSRPPSTKPLDQYKYSQTITEENTSALNNVEATEAVEVDEEDAQEEIEVDQDEPEDDIPDIEVNEEYEEVNPAAFETATAAHNNYVSMTSLYATAPASSASEVSSASSPVAPSSPVANSLTPAVNAAAPPPLAEEAFLPEASPPAEAAPASPASTESPPATPQQQQPQQHTYANPLRFLYL